MANKTIRNNPTLQYRRELGRLLQPQGAGIIFGMNRERNVRQIVNRYIEKESFVPAERIQSQPAPPDNFAERVLSGKLTGQEFVNSQYQRQLNQKYGSAGQDIGTVIYYDYVSNFRPLTDDERVTRAGSLQNVRYKNRGLYYEYLGQTNEREYINKLKENRGGILARARQNPFASGVKEFPFSSDIVSREKYFTPIKSRFK